MYNDVNWSSMRAEATISIYNTLLLSGKPANASMDRAILLGSELVKKLKEQQSADDEKSRNEMDILLGRKKTDQSAK